ncbi:zinc-binding protein A33-like [Cololabis saira]|uniref:zinc-binding protein A33-like n=1 Tax=Cololabis saira TaxID=129043 RepID=UPI002AD4FEE8|nr:zinc-binding protein A33-like [Cololabis saira]
MASSAEKDLTCPICHDIFVRPVVLSCSHSFCKACVQAWWTEKHVNECPVCKASPVREPLESLALRNLCEDFLKDKKRRVPAETEARCNLHDEKLKLFCLDHQQLVCLVCRDSSAHANHSFRPLDEAAQDHRERLQEALRPLREELEVFERTRANWDQTAKHIKVQGRKMVEKIKDQFKTFHQFLHEEEEARVNAVREEEKLKSKMLREKDEDLSRQISAISDIVRASEKELRCADVSFLQNYKGAVEAAQRRPLLDDPQLPPGALMDEAKHLGNLGFNIWNKMKDMVCYSPVILDPNTAHPALILSEDLTSVIHDGARQKLPDNPERFDCFHIVLGSEGFSSGTHSWDVEVGESGDLGMAEDSVPRKGVVNSGLWSINFKGGAYAAWSPSGLRTFSLTKTPRRIRVLLDYDKGKLSFLDADTEKHLHTFTHNFTKNLYPYIPNNWDQQLKILSKKVSVTIK